MKTDRIAMTVAGALLAAASALAQTPVKDRTNAFGSLGSNKEPIKIDADRLDVFDRENRAVFQGNVVAVQGDSTMKCTVLTVFYEQNRNQPGGAKAPAPSEQASADNSIKKIDCKGPVTIVSKTQVATGDNATFDRVSNRMILIGSVALSDGPNVTRGERIVYDLNTGIANVETAPGGRVKALFVPGSKTEGAAGGEAEAKPKSKPQASATN
jgi:lipopolysaccharide export system protein LptA